VGPALEGAVSGSPLFRFTDQQAVMHELWRLERADLLGEIQQGMEADWTFIADGHHRFESAVTVMQEHPEEAGARQVLAFFCSLRDHGFRIFPIHRLIRPPAPWGPEGLVGALRGRFPWQAFPGSTAEELVARLRETGEGSFALLLRESAPLVLQIPKRVSGAAASDPVEEMDTQLLQRQLLTGALGITPERVAGGAVGYTADASEAQRQVLSGEAAAAILMNPLQVESVIRAARAGFRLPQKSTYFYPKVFTGLVLRPF